MTLSLRGFMDILALADQDLAGSGLPDSTPPRRANLPKFDGQTFSPDLDGPRLTSQLERVRELMSDGQWRTLGEIAAATEGSEAGVSARLRDLRKARFGALTIERRRVAGGLYRYRLVK